jgi:DNA-directed RNA polymerase specialized sigma24 family protein
MPRESKAAKDSATDVGFAELHTQLRIMNRLMAAQLKVTTGQQELVRLLSTTGASYAEIADVLDTTAATVATTLQRLRKKTKAPAAGATASGPQDEAGGGGGV